MSTNSAANVMMTIEAIDSRRKKAAAKALDVSLNELADMYKNGELVIRPEYQRMFRWDDEKQSQFIESLILEMPIPPIFAIELEDGKWELIDGLQRLSTYLHFRGVLDAPERKPEPIKIGDELELIDCDILEELNGSTFSGLPPAVQIRLKRSFLRVEVIRETDARFRYYMFKRLNTGGEQLSEQEVRNCTIRLLGNEFNDFLINMARDDNFQSVIATLSDASRQTMGDVELVLRFFAFKNNLAKFSHGISEFMSNYMLGVTDGSINFAYDFEQAQFQKVFKLLKEALDENTCLRWLGNKFGGPFSMHHFEAFSIGVARVIDQVDTEEKISAISIALTETKKDDKLKEHTQGGGKLARAVQGQVFIRRNEAESCFMTAEELRTLLEEDRTSRGDEIRRLRNLLADMSDDAKNEFRRTLIVMTYAHFEGFCKWALISYVVAVNSLKLTSSAASAEIVAASWSKRFWRLENPHLKCDVFRNALPDDTQLHRFARRRDFVVELPNFMSATVCVPDEVVDMESNLSPAILRKNMFRLGLDYSALDQFSPQISELLNRRHGICHGADRKPVEEAEYQRVEDAAQKVMEAVMLAVTEAFSKKRYEISMTPSAQLAS